MSREDPLGQLGYNFWTQVGRVLPPRPRPPPPPLAHFLLLKF